MRFFYCEVDCLRFVTGGYVTLRYVERRSSVVRGMIWDVIVERDTKGAGSLAPNAAAVTYVRANSCAICGDF